MGPGYLQNHLHPITSACPTQSDRDGILQTLSVKKFQLVAPRKTAFSAITATFWNILPPEVSPPSHFPGLLKMSKHLALHLAWGRGVTEKHAIVGLNIT